MSAFHLGQFNFLVTPYGYFTGKEMPYCAYCGYNVGQKFFKKRKFQRFHRQALVLNIVSPLSTFLVFQIKGNSWSHIILMESERLKSLHLEILLGPSLIPLVIQNRTTRLLLDEFQKTHLQIVVVCVLVWQGLMCNVHATAFHISGWQTRISAMKWSISVS